MQPNEPFKILILPLGLIGGSLALALARARRRGAADRLFPQGLEIMGTATRPEVLAQALADGAIDRGRLMPRVGPGTGWEEALEACPELFAADLIIFCTPVETIPVLARFFAARSEALLTDVGSVKGPVTEALRGLRFVGGHPMAGSERTGYYCADEALFDHACYAFCPPDEPAPQTGTETEAETETAAAEGKGAAAETTAHAVTGAPAAKRAAAAGRRSDLAELKDFLRRFAELLGARALFLPAREHDRLVARISHLPHVTASALVNAALAGDDKLALLLSAGGFRDITRIASSDPALWAGISLESGEALKTALDDMIRQLQQVRAALEREDSAALQTFFQTANDKRARVPGQGVGPLVSDVQLLLNIEDKPGVLARLTALLSAADINIHNLSIQDARQYEGGQVRLFISSPSEAARAAQLLKAEGYELLE